MARTNIPTCGEAIVYDGRHHNEFKITFSHRIWCRAHNFWPPSVNNFVKSWLDCVMVCLSLPAKMMVHFKKCAWMAVTPRTAQRLKGSAKLDVFPCVQPIICACVCTRNARLSCMSCISSEATMWRWTRLENGSILRCPPSCPNWNQRIFPTFCYSIYSHITRVRLLSAGRQLDFLPTSINVTNGRFSLLGTIDCFYRTFIIVTYRIKGSDNLASMSFGWEN